MFSFFSMNCTPSQVGGSPCSSRVGGKENEPDQIAFILNVWVNEIGMSYSHHCHICTPKTTNEVGSENESFAPNKSVI